MASVAEVADWLGLSTRRVKELRAEGVLPGQPGADYDLKACVTAYCTHIRPASGKAARGGSEEAGELEVNRSRESRLRGDILELKREMLRAELIPTELMEGIVGASFDAARAKLLAIPAAYGPRLAAEADANGAREMLTKAIHDALGDLADGEVIATVKDRTRAAAGRIEAGDAPGEEAGAAA